MTDSAFALYDAPLWNMALIASQASSGLDRHRLRQAQNGFSLLQYPRLEHLPRPHAHRAKQSRPDPLRRRHPAGAGGAFPGDDRRSLRSRHDAGQLCAHAHERNDEMLERIYIGRRFKNDTERLEKLFELYTKMTAAGRRAEEATQAEQAKAMNR